MTNNEIYKLKQILNEIYQLLDTVESAGGKPSGMDMPLRKCFKTEMIAQSLYFAAADGKLRPVEKDFLNVLFDLDETIESYIRFINDNNIYSTEFENRGLLTLDILNEFDRKVGHLVDSKGVPVVIGFMEDFIKKLLVIDGDVDGNEKKEYFTYFSKLKDKYSTTEGTLIKKGNNCSENSLKEYYLKKKN